MGKLLLPRRKFITGAAALGAMASLGPAKAALNIFGGPARYLNEPGAGDSIIWTGFDSQVGANAYSYMRNFFSVTNTNLSSRTLVLIAAGQSIIGNYAAYNPSPANTVEFLNPYTRTVYKVNGNTATGWLTTASTQSYTSALPGSAGYFNFYGGSSYPNVYGGSWLVNAADQLLTSGLSSGAISRCIIINVAMGSSNISQWASGDLFQRLLAAWTHCVSLGWTQSANFVPAIVWSQGEADVILGTSASAWAASFSTLRNAMVAAGCSAPWFVPMESISSGYSPYTNAANQAIRQGQFNVRGTGVFGSGTVATGVSGTCDFDFNAPTRRIEDGTHPDATSGPLMATMLKTLINANM